MSVGAIISALALNLFPKSQLLKFESGNNDKRLNPGGMTDKGAIRSPVK